MSEGPLIRPSGTFSPLGRRGVRGCCSDSLLPMGEKVAKPDEGALPHALQLQED